MSFHTRHHLYHVNVYHQCPENVKNVKNQCCFFPTRSVTLIFFFLVITETNGPLCFCADGESTSELQRLEDCMWEGGGRLLHNVGNESV